MFKTQLAYDNWKSKYRYGNEEPIETFRRAAKALAEVELEENRAYWEDKFFRAMLRLSENDVPEGIKNTTGGRITANIGTGYGHATLLNCFINGPVSGASIKYNRKTFDGKLAHDVVYQSDDNPDDLINIFLTLLEQAKTLASEGGYGINFDFIRPRGSLIKGTGIMHPGIVSYMKVWDSVSECIVKGTNDGYSDKLKNYLTEEDLKEAKGILKAMTRKGAMMGVLSVNHPDIEEFVRAKQTSGVLTKFNLSVLIDDKFMQAVEKDEMYDLTFKNKVYKRVKARDLYDLIMESTYNRAEPGVLFVDNMDKNNPLAYLGKATCTNPCCRKGTLTATENGLVPVENIKIGDRIQTSLGFEPVENIESHKSHDTYRVSFTDGSYLDVTEGHIFHSQKSSVEARKKWDNQTRLSEMMESPDSWFVRKSPYLFRTNIGLEDYTRDKGLLAGLFLGNGHIDANDKVCISVDKREDSKYIFDLCDRLYLSYWLDDSSKENSRKIVIGGRGDNKSVEVLKSLGLDTNLQASEKTFPYEWLNTNTNFLAGLMDGLLSSDGNVNMSSRYPQIRYKSCSVELHTMVRHLMLYFGADYKLYPSSKKGEKRVILGREVTRKHDSFEGIIDNDSILNVFSGIEFISHPEKNKNLKEIIKKNSLGGVKWKTRVKSIEYIGKHDVYDLYTKESDDWNTCGIVSRGCGEIPGIASLTTTCLLGSINVTQYVNIVDGSPVFDIEMYKEDIKTFTRMLDNVNDITYTPLPSYDWATKNIRQFGMGINGLGSALYMLGIPYNSEEAVKFTKNLCDLKENLTWQASSLLAKEKGTFPAYIKEKFENTEYFLSDRLWPETKEMLRKYGARNGKTTTNPPLGNCVEGSTKITTNEGVFSIKKIFENNGIDINKSKQKTWYIPIKELQVKTLDGFKRITGLFVNERVKTLTLKSNGEKIVKGTEEHKMLVLVGKDKAEWVRLKDVKVGDKIISLQNHQ
jgi:ribonucleoside-diphosphate reductase alpha chain